MSERGDAERTEQPTAKRLREARERGQVPRSRELGGAATLGASMLILSLAGEPIAKATMQWLRTALAFTPADLDPSRLTTLAGTQLARLAFILAPLFLAGLAAGAISPALVSGFSFSPKALTPDFGRVNPFAGFKRLYSVQALGEIAKAVLRVALVGAVGWLMLRARLPTLVGLVDEPTNVAVAHGAAIAVGVLFSLTFALIAIAAVDVPFQIWQHRRQLRMTREEVREEFKESDGRPEVKARIRHAQQALANRRMLEAVPKADAVVVNPTHYAVAIAYDAGRMRAPRVVAKGVDFMAQTIREVALKHHVPIVSAPPLARALYRQVDLNREIPVKLYAAVAQVLSFVYQLQAWRRHGGRMPPKPVIEAPEEN